MAEANLLDPGVVPQKPNPKGRSMAADWMSTLPKLGEETSASPPPPEPVPNAPQAPASEPPPEPINPATPPAQAVENEEEKWPRNANDWEKFKKKRREKEEALSKERDDIKAERDRLNSEIAELKKAGPSPELDAAKKELNELSEQLRLTSIENHPRFKAYYGNKINAQVELAKRIVGKEKADEISGLLALPDSEFRTQRINEVVNGLPPLQQSRIGSVLNALEEIHAERSSEMQRAKTDFDALTAKQKSDQEMAMKQRRDAATKMFDAVINAAQNPQEGLFVFQKRDGDEEWNKGVTERIESARNLIFGQSDPQTLTKAALYATALPAVLRSHKTLYDENAQLKAQIESLKAATPKGGSTAPSNAAPAPEPTSPRQQRAVGGTRQIATDWVKDLHDTRNRAMSQAE